MQASAPESAPIQLHCLGGQAASATIIEDMRQIEALPASARQRIWTVLGPTLREPIPRDIGATLETFVKAHQISGDGLVRALKACRALIRQAITLDLSPQQFSEDLARLSLGTAEMSDVLMPGYEHAKSWLRSEMVLQTVTDHGKLVEDLHWRVDMMVASDRGGELRRPVATVTLRYRDGERREHLTLQLLPDAIKQLRSLCDSVLERR